MNSSLPDFDTLYNALLQKDSNFEGIFFVGVKTTGIFCRPTCTAKKPKQQNVEFFSSAREAVQNGYRPCKLCQPLTLKGEYPDWLKSLMDEVSADPGIRMKSQDLRERGIDPNRVRRWFAKNHGTTFQTFLRTLRIGQAFGRIKYGDKVIEAAFDSGYESLSGFTESFKKAMGFSPKQSSKHTVVTITRILTLLGPMLAGATDSGLCLLEFIDRRMLETQLQRIRRVLKEELFPGSHPLFAEVEKQINEYFAGTRKKFQLPLVPTGTSFQEKVWRELRKIPYGTTRSYKYQAEKMGNVKAVRAVAKANSDNRISIIIPCHRVIGDDGELVGYGGGLWRKKYLLQLESGNL